MTINDFSSTNDLIIVQIYLPHELKNILVTVCLWLADLILPKL